MATWPQQRETLADQLRQSLMWWYRQTYQIPRHDPRLAGLTVEELETEYLAWRAWHQLPSVDPVKEALQTAYLAACADGTLDPSDEAARDAFIAAWQAPGVEPEGAEDDAEPVVIPPPEEG